jgi:hypothetical protein
VAPHHLQDLRGDLVGERAAALHLGGVQMQVGDDPAVGEPHGGLIGPEGVPRK